jgi:branched-chain amino acid transport system ATP-binding protein
VAVSPRGEPLLQVRGVTLRFGGVTAVDDVSLDVARGGMTALIGPNGAGKTSLFNCITGFYKPEVGQIEYAGSELLGVARHKIARLGIARTFQAPGLFDGATVIDNVLVGRFRFGRSGVFSGGFMTPWAVREERREREKAEEILELLGMSRYRNHLASDLPYGLRKRLDFGRALAQEPRLLLLDEPAAGMTSGEKQELLALMSYARESLDATLLLVEHDMSLVMGSATHVVVLDFGRKIADGTAAEVQRSPEVIAAYLGTEAEQAANGGGPG